MNPIEFENFLEALFRRLGDPNRDSGLPAEVDNDFRNAYVEGDDDQTFQDMYAALDSLRDWLDRVEWALSREGHDLSHGLHTDAQPASDQDIHDSYLEELRNYRADEPLPAHLQSEETYRAAFLAAHRPSGG